MTLSSYISEVKLSLARLKVKIDLSDPEIISFINYGRHEVQRIFHRLRPEWFGKITTIPITETFNQNSVVLDTFSGLEIKAAVETLPADTIDVYSVICEYSDYLEDDGVTPLSALARYANSEEFYKTQMHSWALPTIERPIYTIETNRSSNRKEIHFGLPTTIWDDTDVELTVFYTAVIPYIEELNTLTGTQDEENTLPIWADELIVKYATYYALKQTEDQSLAQIVMAGINSHKQLYLNNNHLKHFKWNVDLPSKEKY